MSTLNSLVTIHNYMGMYVYKVVWCLSHFQLQPPSSFSAAKRGRVVRPFLMVLHLYWSRPAQCLLVAHHGYWETCGSRLNCAGSRSRLEPQRYSVQDPSACGYALTLTNPITCCLAGRFLQAKARRMELRNQTTLSQLWVK